MTKLLERACKIINQVSSMYPLWDTDKLPKSVKRSWNNWVRQVPIVGFNCGKYDINLIKRHFAQHLITNKDSKVFVAKSNN